MMLTGGVAESLKFKAVSAEALVYRLENALSVGAFIVTNVKVRDQFGQAYIGRL